MSRKSAARRTASIAVLLGVLVVIAAVAANGASSPATPTITAKPANPTNVQATSFSFTGSGSVTFECALDTATFTACSSPRSYGSLAAGSHTFKVRAKSGTKVSSPATHTWLIDLTAPAGPTVTSGPTPLPGWSTAAPSQFSFTGEAGASYLCSLDGGTDTPCSSGVSYTVSQRATHTFSVKARDAAGNVGPASTPAYEWRVDTVGPATPSIIVQPPDPSSTATSTFNWTESSADVVAFQCSIENGAFAASVPSVGEPSKPCSSPLTFNVATTNNGQHQFAVRAVDAAGNVSGSASYDWKVDKGSLQDFTITGNAQQTLYPGGASSPINLAFANTNGFGLVVTSLTVTVQSVTGGTNLPHACTPADFAVDQFSGAYGFTMPHGSSSLQSIGVPSGGWPTVRMVNRNDTTPGDGTGNQDGCKNATVTLAYTGSAHS